MKVVSWKDLSGQDWNAIVLGNGASIAIHNGFKYQELFEEAERRGLIEEKLAGLFHKFETRDFEYVLERLRVALVVNEGLKIQDRAADEAYTQLRSALIKIVQATHPNRTDIREKLNRAWHFGARFQFVINLNYDLTFYWAFMAGNDSVGLNRFKDGFINGEFKEDWQSLKTPYGSHDRSTLVFYPHGNLVLGTDYSGEERKLAGDRKSSLLKNLFNSWTDDDYIPLFVGEGNSAQKKAAIRRSAYLRAVSKEVLPAIGGAVVVYGWSMGNSDAHILDQIMSGDVKTIAVSIHVANMNEQDIWEEMERIKSKIRRRNSNTRVLFFDAESEGYWINGYPA